MSSRLADKSRKFGTGPVFLTTISTILGAILFLRFGYAVGHLGFLGTLGVILLGHLVTIPTAMAISEIATNQRVEGGGVYFIISRSFGILIGAAIGLALYLSQAISVAFYVIAFGEAFAPVFDWLQERHQLPPLDRRLLTVPTALLLGSLMLTKGANLGVKALYVVVGVLFVSIACFFLGGAITPSARGGGQPLLDTIARPDSFFVVFAICFPAFTGMAAGVGLSGDLRDPRRAIPLGTMSATLVGMAIYTFVAWKLAVSASPDDLAGDQLVMSKIALWGPIIPIGLACATLSSALGSILVAPRTLQALASDNIFPSPAVNGWLAKTSESNHEPVRASLITSAIALLFVAFGDVDIVAQVISMFFMVAYGAICLISFLEHFAADPSYRPVFRSRWYISLFGAVMCLWLMFSMSPLYAALSLALMVAVYLVISHNNPERKGLASLFLEAFFQISRRLQVFLQQSQRQDSEESWRPSVVCISRHSFVRRDAFDLLRWISHRYGFGTYIHFIEGYLSRKTHADARRTLRRLVRMADVSEGNVFVDTLVCPSHTTAISQLVQLPGISGKENNMILLEFSQRDPDGLKEIIENLPLVVAAEFEVCILASSTRGFGYRREIHIWLTPGDYDNAALMILLAYIILGHPEWRKAVIRIYALFPEAEHEQQEQGLLAMIKSGRLPISPQNVELISREAEHDRKAIISETSAEADLTILGFQPALLKRQGEQFFAGYENAGNLLFVSTNKELELAPEEEVEEARTTVEADIAAAEAETEPEDEPPGDGRPDVEKEPDAPAETAQAANPKGATKRAGSEDANGDKSRG